MTTINLLGVSASLRNARFGAGRRKFMDELAALGDREALEAYLTEQSNIILHEFFEKGRADGKPFDEMFRELRSARGDRGLSNSEGALAAALWAAHDTVPEVETRYCGLASHFPAAGGIVNEDELREAVLWSDGIVLSGPVYFGDRGSLAQSFIEFVSRDEQCRAHIRGKVFAGVTVGAKRNGGQETTLIYQIVDAGNLGMLPVGNDSSTTSQYGGTAVAGDVGTFPKDAYGIDTCIGTGMRVAKVAKLLKSGASRPLVDNVRVAVWMLQDDEERKGAAMMRDILEKVSARDGQATFDIIEMNNEHVHRCIACDVCPIEVGPPGEYRCIIKQGTDLFARRHEELLDYDAILVAAYSPKDRTLVHSVYQKFIERTRYIRRDDYQWSDRLCAPFVISEIGSNQNLHIRMLTSMVRHDTVLHHPMLVFEHEGNLLNVEDAVEQGLSFCRTARDLTAGRLANNDTESKRYNPVGYVVSLEKSREDEKSGELERAAAARSEAHESERQRRLG